MMIMIAFPSKAQLPPTSFEYSTSMRKLEMLVVFFLFSVQSSKLIISPTPTFPFCSDRESVEDFLGNFEN